MCESSGACVHVGGSADANEAESVVVKGGETLLVPGGVVHSADHAVAESSQFEVVQLQTVHVVTVVHVVVASHSESHGAEAIADFRVVGVAF